MALDTAGTLPAGSRRSAGDGLDVVDKSVMVLRSFTAPTHQPDHSAAASLALLRSARTPRTP